jgi:hypothetical protein
MRNVNNQELTDEQIRSLCDNGAALFDPDCHDQDIVSVTDDGRAVYCMDRFLDTLGSKVLHDDLSSCIEWFEYNTLPVLEMMPLDKRPIFLESDE